MLLPNLSALAQPTGSDRKRVYSFDDAKRPKRGELERQLAMSRANEASLRAGPAQMDEDDLKRRELDKGGAEDRMSRWLSEVSPWTFENLTDALASSDALREDYRFLVEPANMAQTAVREMYRSLLPERVKLLDWYEKPQNTAAFRDLGRVQAWKKAGAASSLSQEQSAYNYIHVSNPPLALQEWGKVTNRYIHMQLQGNDRPRETAAETGNKLKLLKYMDNNVVDLPMHEFLSGAMRTDNEVRQANR